MDNSKPEIEWTAEELAILWDISSHRIMNDIFLILIVHLIIHSQIPVEETFPFQPTLHIPFKFQLSMVAE
jgi:hypothetical protein